MPGSASVTMKHTITWRDFAANSAGNDTTYMRVNDAEASNENVNMDIHRIFANEKPITIFEDDAVLVPEFQERVIWAFNETLKDVNWGQIVIRSYVVFS